jgi:CHAT domain-containing protein
LSPRQGLPKQLSPLPGTEQEAKAIAQILKRQPIIGNKATKTAIAQRMQKARIIHLATHGLFDDEQGLQSAIALAPDSPSSGGNKGIERNNGLLNDVL